MIAGEAFIALECLSFGDHTVILQKKKPVVVCAVAALHTATTRVRAD